VQPLWYNFTLQTCGLNHIAVGISNESKSKILIRPANPARNRTSPVDAASAGFSVACATRDLAPRVVSLLSNGENAAGC
jgi:hypothetical protein